MIPIKKQFYVSLAIVIIYLFPFLSIFGQTPKQVKSRKYKTWVTRIDNSSSIKGYMSEVGDSSIIISNLKNIEKQRIYFNDIKIIKFRRKGEIGRGVLFGALTGFAVGGLIGLASGDDKGYLINFTAGEKGLLAGTLLTIPGAIIGGLLGSIKIKIPINGNTHNQKAKLLKYKLSY